MSIEEAFSAYARAFLETFEDGDWSRLEPFFSPDAVFLPGDGRELSGRQEILNGLEHDWDSFDRRFDARQLELTCQPVVAGSKVTIQWKATYEKADFQELVLSGSEELTFEGNVITRLEDSADDGVMETLAAWMNEYGDRLAE